MTYTQVEKYFNGQLIDHFNKQDTRTYSQRYYVVDDYYKPGAPIFLYLCGESTCLGVRETRAFALQVAQQHNALYLVLEHRYYGKSQPFKDHKTENLAYLTADQALEDIAYFIGWFKVNSGYQISPSQPWLTIGGSYPGALSAWFRYKYPHLVAGAWASSAVVEAIADYEKYDYQIYLSTKKSGLECPSRIQKLNAHFEYQIYNTTAAEYKAFQDKFGPDASKLSKDELMWLIADQFSGPVQSGTRSEFCKNITGPSDFNVVINQTLDWIISRSDPKDFGSYFLKSDKYDIETVSNMRQWTYQVCTQFGWWQTPAADSFYATRSKRVSLDFFRQYCKDIFGQAFWPNTDRVNTRLGGFNLISNNLLMTNGAEDPWKWASLVEDKGDIKTVYIDCDDCSHCIDLRTPSPDDPVQLSNARKAVINFVDKVLKK